MIDSDVWRVCAADLKGNRKSEERWSREEGNVLTEITILSCECECAEWTCMPETRTHSDWKIRACDSKQDTHIVGRQRTGETPDTWVCDKQEEIEAESVRSANLPDGDCN